MINSMLVAKKFSLIVLLISGITASSQQTPPAPVLPVPNNEQMRWHEMEMNAFVHFSINTFTDREWGYGDESAALFNPSQLDANQWTRILKAAGFRTLILTCKHHDGFCLWPSAYTDHSIRNSPYKEGSGNLVAEVREAARNAGLEFGIYLSPWDRNRADYGDTSYIRYYRNQLAELFAANKPVFEMWFDGANGGDGYYGGAGEKRSIDGAAYYDWPTTLNLVRGYSPNTIFFSDAGPGVRWVGNERGRAGETNWNTISTDTLFAGKAGIETLLNTGSPDGDKWVPAETDVSIRPGWFYHAAEDSMVKTPEQLFDIYLTSVGRGSTLLLNVPPDRRGLIHPRDSASLMGFRHLLATAFHTDFAAGAVATASSFRGTNNTYAASMVNDGKKDTYWCTDDDKTSGSIELQMKDSNEIRFVVLQEYIPLGQRVSSFAIDIWMNGVWHPVAGGTTIGYKRIVALKPVKTSKLRLRINSAKACPVISCVQLF